MTGGRRWHLLGVGLVGLVLLGVGAVFDKWLPADTDDPGSEPFLTTAEVGDAIDLRTMSVEVDAVRATRTLMQDGSELRSPGVWVLVEYTVVHAREDAALGFAELRDGSGRVWSLGGRNDNICPHGPPGVPISCVAYFEVPTGALDNVRLRLASEPFEQRYDAMAEVDLGLTDEDAAAASDSPELEVPDTAIGGRP